jgi:hypothetical protein
MTRLVGLGLVLVVATEVFAVVVQRSLTLVLSGVVVALNLYFLRSGLSVEDEPAGEEERDRSPEEALRQWLARTEALVRWADRSRGDWDRHLRPLLAREFEMVTGHRQGKDRSALDATGRMTFGADLWPWVDPFAVSYTDRDQPAPGRAALDAILQRLVRM